MFEVLAKIETSRRYKTLPAFVTFISLVFVLLVTASAPYAGAEVIRQDKNPLSRELGLPAYIWQDTGAPPRVAVIALPGLVLQGRSFDALAHKLASRNILVVSTDFRGFGAWYNGKEGFTRNTEIDMAKSEADLMAIYDKIAAQYHVPIIWMGESFGANTAMRMSAQKGGGLILSSYNPKQHLYLHPRMIEHSALCWLNPRRYVNISPYLNPELSENPSITKEIASDPLNRYDFTVFEIFKMARFAWGAGRMSQTLDPQTPVLIIHGQLDHLNRTADIQEFYAQLQCKDKQLVLLNDKGHIHLETSHLDPQLIDTISNWALGHGQSGNIVAAEKAEHTND